VAGNVTGDLLGAEPAESDAANLPFISVELQSII